CNTCYFVVYLCGEDFRNCFRISYAFSDSLSLTPLCCDDIHDVTPCVSSLAGCDRLVSEPGESLRFSEFVMFLLEFRWCLRFMGKRTNKNARPVSFGAYGDERVVGIIARAARATKEREVQGQSGVKRKLFGSCKDNIGNELILALPGGMDDFVVMWEARVRIHAWIKREGWNMRYRRWMELFSEYGCETKYNMGKANEVVDAGSRKDGVKPRRVQDICKTELVEIMDREIRKLKCKLIALMKVRWNSKHGPKFTWEHEDRMRINYAFSDSLLLIPLCCDDIHDVTPRVSALAGCDIEHPFLILLSQLTLVKNLGAYEMLQGLKTLFAQQAEQELLQTMREFHSCKQEERHSVSS
nr:zinc finger, CCHC-type [Tanacetum cinerariifolium]